MFKYIVLSLCFGAVLATESHGKLPLAGHMNFMEFMLATRDASQRDAAITLECFDYYVPILNDITAEYEKNYAACLKTADVARAEIDGKTEPDRIEIEDSAISACTALEACTRFSGSIDYFNCFMNVGGVNSRVMSGISFNASEILMGVREQYRLIEDQQNRCTNASERAYVENTATTYEELQGCLQGKAPIPTTTTTNTPAYPTTVPSSTAPAESTTITEPTAAPEVSSTTEAQEVASIEGIRNRNYLPVKDSQWRHLLGQFRNNLH